MWPCSRARPSWTTCTRRTVNPRRPRRRRSGGLLRGSQQKSCRLQRWHSATRFASACLFQYSELSAAIQHGANGGQPTTACCLAIAVWPRRRPAYLRPPAHLKSAAAAHWHLLTARGIAHIVAAFIRHRSVSSQPALPIEWLSRDIKGRLWIEACCSERRVDRFSVLSVSIVFCLTAGLRSHVTRGDGPGWQERGFARRLTHSRASDGQECCLGTSASVSWQEAPLCHDGGRVLVCLHQPG